ncbi:hypothetical protein NOCA280006 [metagenome]|uniref:Uncharacterized protein n=1 Tax=metagenome TaxID=256318 RepID=A0A2P2CEY9_9ZZZZ
MALARDLVSSVTANPLTVTSLEKASGVFLFTRGTLSTLVLIRHKGNTFHKKVETLRRVDLTNYKVVILGVATERDLPGSPRTADQLSTGTDDVVVVGWEASPRLSNFCPLASPPI